MANQAAYRDQNFGNKINVLGDACGRYMRTSALKDVAMAAAMGVTTQDFVAMKAGEQPISDAQLIRLGAHHTIAGKHMVDFVAAMKGSDADSVKAFFQDKGDQVSSNRLPYFGGPITVVRRERHGPLVPL